MRNLEKENVQVSINKQINASIWYNPVTTEAELKITKNDKTATLQAATSLELKLDQEWANDKHI